MATFSIFILPAMLFVLALVFGFWLSRLGRPYNGFLFNIHKLVALGAVVVAVVPIAQVIKTASPLSLIAPLILATFCVIALFVSGALMSAGQLDYALTSLIHRLGSVGLMAVLGLVAYGLRELNPFNHF